MNKVEAAITQRLKKYEISSLVKEVVYVGKPLWFEDGDQSFWYVRVGVLPNSKVIPKANAVLRKSNSYISWDKVFTAPHKKFQGLRLNRINSKDADPNNVPSLGSSHRRAVVKSLTDAGIKVESSPLLDSRN